MNENEKHKLEQESIVAALVDTPRLKIHLLKYEFGSERHFLIRRLKWSGGNPAANGSEIKLEEEAAQVLVRELGVALNVPRPSARPAHPTYCTCESCGVDRGVDRAQRLANPMRHALHALACSDSDL